MRKIKRGRKKSSKQLEATKRDPDGIHNLQRRKLGRWEMRVVASR